MGKKPFFIPLLLSGLLIAGIPGRTNAQEKDFTVSAQTDSSLMVIGGQMDLTLEVSQPANIQVVFPNFTDTITKSIEIVESRPADTTRTANNYLSIKKVYRITSFDSGLHYIPPIEFELASANLKEKRATRSLGIMVANPFKEVDVKKGITDIKSPLDTPFTFAELLRFLPWILGFLLVGLLIAGIIYWRIKHENPLSALIKEKPKEPAHVVALRRLEQIKEEKAWQKGQTKHFHSEVTDVLRQYLEDRYSITALEKTTPEILQSLKTVELPNDQVSKKLNEILTLADLVKFAKYEPLPDENNVSLINAFFFVNQTRYEELKPTEEVVKELQEQKDNEKNKS